MSEETNLPVRGWYPDPEAPARLRRWTGSEWTDERREFPVAETRHRPVGRGFARLTTVVESGLRLTVLDLTAAAVIHVWGRSMFHDAATAGNVDRLNLYDNLARVVGIGYLVLLPVTGLAWMVWQYQLARAVVNRASGRGPGMHAFSWIIPIVVLWFPLQNIRQLWREFVPTRGEAAVTWWWTAWIGMLALSWIGGQQGSHSHSLQDFESVLVWRAAFAMVGLAGAVLALRIIRELSLGGLAAAAASQAARPPG